MTPDGQSMITSVGIQDSTVWVHDAKVSIRFLPKGVQVLRNSLLTGIVSITWLPTAKRQTINCGLRISTAANSAPVLSIYSPGDWGVLGRHYSISKDETAVTFSMRDKAAHSHLWICVHESQIGAPPD